MHAGEYTQHRYLLKNKPQVLNNRQIHILAGELFEELSLAGFQVRAGEFGENVTTKGLELGRLPLGTLLQMGPSAVVELTGMRTPCSLIDRLERFETSQDSSQNRSPKVPLWSAGRRPPRRFNFGRGLSESRSPEPALAGLARAVKDTPLKVQVSPVDCVLGNSTRSNRPRFGILRAFQIDNCFIHA